MIESLKWVGAWLAGPGGILKVRALLTLGITVVIMYMYVDGIAIPEALYAVWGMILAFYFGTRAGQTSPLPPEELDGE